MIHDIYLAIYGLPYWVIAVIAAAIILFGIFAHILLPKRAKILIGWIGTAAALALILFATVFNRSENGREMLLIPFYCLIRASFVSPEYLRMALLNVFLFLPYGVFVPLAFSMCRRRKNVLITLLSGAVISIIIEISQYIFSFGCMEVDDVLCNVLGVLIGLVPYFIIYPIVYRKNT